jgi:hypothetical protein
MSYCPAGDFLKPDEVTFAVLLRGYGAQDPPAWQQIDATLTRMKVDFSIDPSIGAQQFTGITSHGKLEQCLYCCCHSVRKRFSRGDWLVCCK